MTTGDRPSNHALVGLALLSLFTFAGVGDKTNAWLWVSLHIMGCGAALSAAYSYCKEDQDAQTQHESDRLLQVATEIKEGYQWQQHNLQLHHSRRSSSTSRRSLVCKNS